MEFILAYIIGNLTIRVVYQKHAFRFAKRVGNAL